MARTKYTAEYIQKLIDDNGWAPQPKERQETETWQRASKESTEIPAVKSGGSSASPSKTKKATRTTTKTTSKNNTIPSLLPGISAAKGYDIDQLLSDDYKMSSAESRFAKDYADNYMDEYQRKVQNGEYTTDQLIAISKGEDEEFNKMRQLQNKSSDLASFALGLTDMARPAVKLLGNALQDEQYDRSMEAFQQAGSDARTQSPIAYGAGDTAANIALYTGIQGALSEIPFLNNASNAAASKVAGLLGGGERATKIAKSGINVLGDTGLDVFLDVIPSMATDRTEGLSDEQVRNNALFNVGTSLAGNVLGEAAIPFLGKAFSRLRGGQTAGAVIQAAKAAEEPVETAAKATAESVQMPEVEEMDILDFAEAPKKISSVPKTTVPQSSKFRSLDNEVSKLVRMYGDDSMLSDLEDFRRNIVNFENTGSIQASDNASRALQRMDEAMQGKTYTYGETRTKSGARKKAGTTYTYGREYAGINDLVDDARQQFDDVFQNKDTFSSVTDPGQTPQLDEDISEVIERKNPISAARRESDRLVYRPEKESSEDIWEQLQAGSEQFFKGSDPDLEYLARAQKRAEKNGEYITRTATNTLTNSEIVKNSPELQSILKDEIDSGRLNFKTVTEDESLRAAKEAYQRDPVGETSRLMDNNWRNAQDFDGGMMLLKAAADSKDYNAVREIVRKISSEGHDAGVRLQALAKYSRTPEGALAKAQNILNGEIKNWQASDPNAAKEAKRVADEILSSLDDMLSGRSVVDGNSIKQAVTDIVDSSKIANDITDQDLDEITKLLQNGYADQVEDMVNSIMATQQYGIKDETIDQVVSIFDEANKLPENSRQRVRMEEKAYALLANEVTTSNWRDKWDAWRYLAMLSKPATHERNIIGNMGMNVISGVKNNLAAVMESALDRVAPNGIRRTRSVLNPLSDRGLIKAAADDAENVAYRALSGSKYNVTGGIKGQSKAFRKGPGKAIQWLSDKNSGLLEAEDWIGLKAKYSTSLAGYLKANGLDASALNSSDEAVQAIVNQAREFSIEEAKKATFHEASTLADNLTQFSRNMRESNKKTDNAIGMLIEGIVPFKKTPINIVKTAGRYSPANIVNAVAKGVQAVRKGTYTASEVLDSLASGLTGTGIMALGAYLGSQGLIRGTGSDDEDQNAFDELQGAQNYSLVTDDGNYTIDWAAPSVLPLLVGVELQQSLSDGGIDSSDLLNAITSLADPIIETTMMSGISNALSSVQYAEDDADVLSTFATNALTGYATQGIPSSLGAVTRAIDNTRRTSYSDSTGAAGELEYTLNSTKNKIPFLSDDAPEYRDAWGRTQENFQGGGGLAGNLAYQFFSPGYYSEDTTTPNDTYLQGLYDRTGEASVLPKNISRSYGSGEKMTGEEYSEAQRIAGQTSYELIDALRMSRDGLSESSQAEIASDVYGLSKAIALESVVGKDMSDSQKKLYSVYQDQGAEGLIEYLKIGAMANTDGKGSITQDEARSYLDSTNLSNVQKAYYWKLINSGWKTNPYE